MKISSSSISGFRTSGMLLWVKCLTIATRPLVIVLSTGKILEIRTPGSPKLSTVGPPDSLTTLAVTGPLTETYLALLARVSSSVEIPVPTTTEFGLMKRPIEPSPIMCLRDAILTGDWKKIFLSV